MSLPFADSTFSTWPRALRAGSSTRSPIRIWSKTFGSEEWSFDEFEETIAAALDRIAKTGVAMELNTSGLRKRYPEVNPGLPMLRLMCERGIPVVVGSDAHRPQRVSADFETALDLVEAAGYADVSFFVGRRRQTLPVAAARASLRTPVTA